MADVSISHADEDRAAAEAIRDAIAQAGLDVVREPAVAPESPQHDSFAARCVIFLWSHAAAQSTAMQKNVQHAIRAWSEGRLVLAIIDDAALPVGMRDLQGVPVRHGAAGLDTDRLEAEVRSIAAISGAPQSGLDAGPASRRRSALPLVAVLLVLMAGGLALLWIGGDFDSRSKGRGGGGMGRPGPQYETGVPQPVPAPPPPQVLPRPKMDPPAQPPAPPAQVPQPAPAPAPPPPPASAPPVGGAPSAGPALPPIHQPIAERHDTDSLLLVLAVLVLGVAIGAGIVWIGSLLRAKSRRRMTATPQPVAAVALDGAHQVFVSYSRQDGRAVDSLVREIEQAGYAVWIDRHSTGSQRYAAPIVRAIKSSQIVALMCSHNAFSSDHVIREVYVAGDYKKPFIAFQLDTSEFPDDVLYFVSGFPRVQTEALDIQQLRAELARLVAA